MSNFKNILSTALILTLLSGFSVITAQEQSQPLNFYTCDENFSAFFPVEFGGAPAEDGWAIQVVCAGEDGLIDPPDGNGNPSGDDFLAHPDYNNVQVFYFNADENSLPPGNFWMLKSINCRAQDFMPGEDIIRVGDAIYLRAFNAENPAEASDYADMAEPYTVELVAAGLPLDVYNTEFYLSADRFNQPDLVITEYKLHQNYPNPFNPSTAIQYDVLESGKVYLAVYNIAGQEVISLVNGAYREGGRRYTVQWNAEGLSSGIYFYRLRVNDFKSVKKLLLLQ